MDLRRRRLLALVPITVAGCGQPRADGPADGASGERTASPPVATPTGSRVQPQSLSVGNTRSDPAFVTVAVEFEGDPLFVESRELVPGERYTTDDVLATAGRYDVVVDTSTGSRAAYRWTVVGGLDGLSVTLTDEIQFLRTVRCDPDCAAFLRGTTLETPLVGDGSGRWYAPARVVLANPGTTTVATLSVAVGDETLVDARFRVPRETQVVVPLTYRSGTYQVEVEAAGGRVAGAWHVPAEPSRVVDLATLDVGCGPANTRLRVTNADDRSHTVRVIVERDGVVRFADQYDLDPTERRDVVPVTASGQYELRVRVDGGREQVETWWACPPTGPATVLVDGTGTATLQSLR